MFALIDEAQAAARVDRRRRAAGALPRAERDSAADGRDGHLHAARHERRAPDSSRMGRPPRLQIVVSIDGLQPEHDERRKPATYERILKHIDGHHITVHCTVTRQQVRREGYLEEFAAILVGANRRSARSGSASTRRRSARCPHERLTKADRQRVVADLLALRPRYPKLRDAEGLLDAYVLPPRLAGRMHLRADDGVRVGEFREADHAVPVRRQSRLRQLRLHRVGRPGGGRATACRAGCRCARSSTGRRWPGGW